MTSFGVTLWAHSSAPGCCSFPPLGCTSQKCQAAGFAEIKQSGSALLEILSVPGVYTSGNGTQLGTRIQHNGECGTSRTVEFYFGGAALPFCTMTMGCSDC